MNLKQVAQFPKLVLLGMYGDTDHAALLGLDGAGFMPSNCSFWQGA